MRTALRLLWVSGLMLGHAASAAYAEKGDLFLSLAPVIDAAKTSAPAFGGGASFQLGVNEATDFMLESDITFADDGGETTRETRILLGSLYTPYFGDIRPRFGGSGGIVHVDAPEGVSEVYFNLGFHLQGLYDASDRIRLFAEAHPNLTFGTHGDFSTLMKVGLIFRLSK